MPFAVLGNFSIETVLGIGKIELKVSILAEGLPEGVHGYAEWQESEVANGHKKKPIENDRFLLLLLVICK